MRHLAPFVGRADELTRLSGLVGLDGRPGGRVLLTGDAGAGKTRLVGELVARAEADGWRVLTGHCLDLGDGSLPYLPFREMFGRLSADEPAVVSATPALAPLVTAVAAGAGAATGAVDRGAVLEAVHALLLRLAERQPLLVVVEDLHWADRSTQELLGSLFARPGEGPVAVVATVRGEDVHRQHPLRPALSEWARLPGLARLTLRPLPEAEAVRLVHALVPAGFDGRSARRIVDRAEGNPFYVEELVAASAEAADGLPPELADVLLVRLDRLEPEVRTVLRAAAVAGHRVGHTTLVAVSGLPSETVEQAVRTAVEVNLLVPSDDGYAFRHALLAEAVSGDLLPVERVRLHAAYAAALEGHDRPGLAAELARHASASHDNRTAARASIRAGDEALALGGPEEASRHFETALELAADPEVAATLTVTPSELVVRAGLAAVAAGRLGRAVDLAAAAAASLPDAAPASERARLLWAVVTFSLLSETDRDLVALARQAEELVPEPTGLRAEVLAVLARALTDRARDDEARRRAHEAFDLATELGLSGVQAEAQLVLARIDERAGDPGALLGTVEQVVASALRTGDVAGELRALYLLGRLHFELGDLVRADEIYAHAATRSVEVGRPWAPFGLDARAQTVLVAYAAGHWQLADRLLADADDLGMPAEARAVLTAVGLTLDAARGEPAAMSRFDAVRPFWNTDGLVAVSAAGAGIELWGHAGDWKAARRVHEEAVAVVAPLWGVAFPAQLRLGALLLGQLASAVSRLGRTSRLEVLGVGAAVLEQVDAVVSSTPWLGKEGRAWAARARAEGLRLRWLAGDAPSADALVEAWETTVVAFEAFHHVPEGTRSRLRLAEAWTATGQVDAARSASADAREVLRALGATAWLRALGPAVAASAGPVRREGEPLTPRETEVLALLDEGRSNGEIAARLYISVKTVSVHVSNILAKFGASSRSEAAALARAARPNDHSTAQPPM
ncbi:MAG: hypothetical protein QOG60_282 [Frankiaceae bacterium]|nr:hypothetical protein [Frankiaceae bacterium]